MRRILTFLGGSLLSTAALIAAPCAQSPTTLCLNASRFEVEVSWRDSRGRTGVGQAVPITADTGYFWFFSETNIELVVKVLDARSVNQKFWVFFGALSNVEYDLAVTDTVTGAVKTYHNPLGQFASVGDTGAFDPAPPAPLRETITAEGSSTPPGSFEDFQAFIDAALDAPSAGAFTPCPDTGAYLYLANCRFRLDVHWTDSRGRHGAGRPVQLTNDTGYFWFFSEANVELMIKVLDARPVNGRFWVFFGALSNVAYSINITDTVSGALRSYQNPQSAFASVGDTSAFRGGFEIDVSTDDPLAVSGLISAEEGGSLSATSTDGTVFTLLIPPDSLLDDELVTITPVRSVGRFPFAGRLVAGVDIQPSGTPLVSGATLTIHTSAPVDLAEETPVAWNGSGEDFFLFPPTPAAGDLQMDISHLAGYGVARGTEAERQAQLPQEPIAEADRLSHQISLPVREGRAEAGAASRTLTTKATAEIWRDRLVTILDARYRDLRGRMTATDGEPGVVTGLILEGMTWIRQVEQGLGPVNTAFPPDRLGEIRSLFKRMASLALQKIKDRCSEDANAVFDIYPLVQVVRSARLLDSFPELGSEIRNTIGCLTFLLRFESTIVVNGESGKFTYRVRAEDITLRPGWVAGDRLVVFGEGPLRYAFLSYPQEPRGCSVTSVQSGSTLKAKINFPPFSKTPVGMVYDPGTPRDEVKYRCPGPPVFEWAFKDLWLNEFNIFHFNDVGGATYRFRANTGWVLTGQKAPFAIKIIAKALGNVEESTTFTLTHAPE